MRTFHARLGALIAVLGVVAVLGAPAAVAAGGGNSANAQECQKGGWQDWVREDGLGFKNPGSCVGYAALGGKLTPRLPVICYDATTSNAHDLAFVGPIDTPDNAVLYSSVNGTCSGGKVDSGTVVQADDATHAVVRCRAIVGSGFFAISLNTVGYSGAASDLWGCIATV